MPIVDAKEGSQLDQAVGELLDAPAERQEALLRRVLVEYLDLQPTSGPIVLTPPPPDPLPAEGVRLATLDGVQVVMVTLESERVTTTAAKAIIKAVANQVGEHLLAARTQDGSAIHLIYPRTLGSRTVLKRIVFERGRPRRTAVERLAQVYLERERSGADARTAIEHAFDVEAVTREFYEEYEALFRALEAEFANQSGDATWAHDYALQLLNRVMFLYFIDRKGWLEQEFLKRFWQSYRLSKQPADTFFDRWLKVLFFEAFNDNFSHPSYMPPAIQETLQNAPWLNGGLFERNPLDEAFAAEVSDDLWRQVMDFFDSYNFTIAESTPWDQEVAVDPEMIGKVYESLVNVSEVDERGQAGIFYTPRTEIDLMCRLAIVDSLTNHLGEKRKSLLYGIVFAVEPEEKDEADKQLRDENLWPEFDALLHELAVVDPACGSGSFLVGMLQVLDDLLARADRELGREETPYERKKRIIGQSLYGVDVMEWAVHVAELRLWLQLVIDTEIDWAERKLRPLLPNLSFKIRAGDSLVQEVGGVNMSHVHGRAALPASIKGQLTKLKGEKLRYYNSEEGHLTEDQLSNQELKLFRTVLDRRIDDLRRQLREKEGRLEAATAEQGQLPGLAKERGRQASLEENRLQADASRLEADVEQAQRAREALVSTKDVPFVWDIAYVEVFEGDTQGFDIVIGNPPYVWYGRIVDPRVPSELATLDTRKAYRESLSAALHRAYPHFFGYRAATGSAIRKADAKSDLYIYFYFLGLALLNPAGSFCFITSNSWVDVGYGRDLQEFLLRHCRIKMVLDNETRRSFAAADINTIIVLLSAPDGGNGDPPDNLARFVMCTAPFEEILSSRLLEDIQSASERTTEREYRVFPMRQETLLSEGQSDDVVHDDEDEPPGGSSRAAELASRYQASKWGGIYLRAPDIYFVILDKGKHLISQLSRVVDGERYLNTGGADGFFILDKVEDLGSGLYRVRNEKTASPTSRAFEGEIDSDFLKPLVKDVTRLDKRIEINEFDAYCLVVQRKVNARLKKYIQWGERQGYDKRSVTKNQRPWYRPTNQMTTAAPLLVPRSFNDSFVIFYNPKDFLSLRYYRLHPKAAISEIQLAGFLNTTLVAFFLETLGNKSLGQGVLDFFMADFLRTQMPIVLNPDMANAMRAIKSRPISGVVEEFGAEPKVSGGRWNLRVPDDRECLDDVAFDAIGLTKGEREGVYEAVLNQVEARSNKARSLEA